MSDLPPRLENLRPLPPEEQKAVLGKALIARFVEERLLSLFSEGKLFGTVHTCIGQEFSGAAVARALRPGDTIFSNHRCHGHFLSHIGDIQGLIAELMGRSTGVSAGMGGSQHLCKDGFFSNGIQGGIVPVAAGLAMGHKIRDAGGISVVFIGDGTLGEGVVYETLNIVAKWQLPLLIVVEDNKYSQSTAQDETLAGTILARAQAFGIATGQGDTWNWQELCRTTERLVEDMRVDRRPRLLQIETFRLKAHSKGDDTRPRSVVEPFEQIDPLNRYLAEASGEEAAWIESLRAQVEEAVRAADQAPSATLPQESRQAVPLAWTPALLEGDERIVAVLNSTFQNLMAQHPGLYMIGEDIRSPYGGAFKATKGLSDLYPDRVINTPIAEAAIVGIGCGLGLLGFLPVVEIMFGDFLGLAFDQLLNHAAKFHQMYAGQVQTPLVVRTPMGGGRGYGPTHSQTLDRHFLGIPGLRVLAMNHLTSPQQLYGPLFDTPAEPTLVIENKQLYGTTLLAAPPRGFELLHSNESFPTALLKPQAERVDVTLLGYGGTSELLVEACEALFEEHDLIAQLVMVMQIYPFSVAPLATLLTAAPTLAIIEEGQRFAGFGTEVVAQLAEGGHLSGLSIVRISPEAHCIPSCGPLEKAFLPSVEDIVHRILNGRKA